MLYVAIKGCLQEQNLNVWMGAVPSTSAEKFYNYIYRYSYMRKLNVVPTG